MVYNRPRGPSKRTMIRRATRPALKRKRQEDPRSFKAKRARTAKKTKRVKTGAYAGQLIASKPVKITKRGVRIRERYAAPGGTVSDTNRLWTGGNTIGDEQFFFSLVAEAMMQHILTRINDTRSDKDHTVVSGFLERIEVQFMREAQQYGGVASSRGVIYDIFTTSNSFNGMVYNNIVGATPNETFYDGAAGVTNLGMRDWLYDMAIEGYYPTKLFLYRTDGASPPNRHEILRDTQFAKANIKIDIKGLHKFQNVTPADHVDSAQYNANAIDSNPLSGKIFTFRNLAPRFNLGWLSSQSSSAQTTMQRLSGRPVNRNTWDYKQISGLDDAAAGIGLPVINEFKLPPLRPRTIFSNVKTSDAISIPPGGFKTFKTRFTFDGSLFRLIRDITQVTINPVDKSPNENVDSGTKYPSLGSSFVLCLTPTMKTGVGGDSVTCGFDFTKDGQAHMTKYSAGTMPTTNVVE